MRNKTMIRKFWVALAVLCMSQVARAQVSEDRYINFTDTKRLIQSAAAHAADGTDVGSGSGNNSISAIYDNNKYWWVSSKNGDVYIDLSFVVELEFREIMFEEGGDRFEQVSAIEVQIPDGRGGWATAERFSSLAHRDDRLTLAFSKGSVSTSALRIFLHTDSNDKPIAIDEIEFVAKPSLIPTIRHKASKWYAIKDSFGLSSGVLGTFRDDQPMFDPAMSSAEPIQAAHTYIDTIYMHKGSTTNLVLPTINKNNSSSVQTYQRWYSYSTDGTFETNHQDHGGTSVYDLLTPVNSSDAVYRFDNGYVGRPLGSIVNSMTFYYPTNDQFEAWFPNSNVDNNWFVVACDVSGYTDFMPEFVSNGSSQMSIDDCRKRFEENGYYEPTLAVRVIYYIVGVDERPENDSYSWNNGHGRLLDDKYNSKGDDNSADKYLEEYDITFPNKHVSDHTDELVALSKDAVNYAIPVEGTYDGTDTDALDIVIDSRHGATTGLLELVSTAISGNNRVIKFRRKGAGANSTWEVPDGTTATIKVTKKFKGVTYNIARFNLTFSASSVPLTQHQVAAIGAGDSLEFRSPDWMNNANNLTKLTELTFDEGYASHDQVGYGQDDYFHFPMAWEYCSYAFFDGSPLGDYIGLGNYNGPKRWYPEFDHYSIVNDYIGYGDVMDAFPKPPTGLGKDDGKYFVYVDASDRPGILARLPFEEKLCAGSELFVTAWMKSGGQAGSDDAAILFTVMGVKEEADGSKSYTPLYRHSSGQIRTTYHLATGVPGTGADTNDWYQIYFSFLNDDPNASQFDSYILQLENNCASTTGGDYYFDEIKVYIAQPNARVSQKEYTCTNTRTRMNIELDWERLMSRLGGEGTGDEEGISFCFIDETKYNNYLASAGSGDDLADKTAAIDSSIVLIGDWQVINTRLMSMFFNTTFEKNDSIGYSSFAGHDSDTIPQGQYFFAYQHMKDGKPYFYRSGSGGSHGNRNLTVDFYSVLSPNRPYLMLIVPADPNLGERELMEFFAAQMDDDCRIVTRFYVTSEAMLKVNGEVVDPDEDFCAGQIYNFTVQVRVPNADGENEGYLVIDDGVYFDWFFGTEEEFVTDDPDYDTNLDVALTNFRSLYPDATVIDATTGPAEKVLDDGTLVRFTQDEYDLISKYANDRGQTGGVNSRLVLHREDLDIALLSGGLQLVVKPIQTVVPPDSSISDSLWSLVCWEYIPLLLKVSSDAPSLHAGFEEVKYPADDFNPALRIGLGQIREASAEGGRSLRVSLRNPKIVSDGATALGEISEEGNNRIYMVDSDDPQYKDYFTSADFDQFSLPIGTIDKLWAAENNAEGGYMDIKFDLQEQQGAGGFSFNPREGYTYTFVAWFEEKNEETGEVYTTCYGSFPVDMKVVPENLVWNGGANDNWNNDSNWRRADSDELHKPEGSGYITNEANQTGNGFVPMLFSNVVMPQGSRAQLYMAGYADGGAWTGTSYSPRPEGMGDPTKDIQYDLMVYDPGADGQGDKLTTERFRVNICRDIHFEPGAQLLHAEQLIYNRAWMDVAVPSRQWTLMATPLCGVVAGDWYANADGSQADEEYFKDITFDNGKHSRLDPAVYQRSWTGLATIVENDGGGKTPVAFGPLWSSVYNDAHVPYTAGGGFSMKTSGSGQTVFRMPKADLSYDVSTGTIDRSGQGRLFVSGLLDRSNPKELRNFDSVEVALTPSADGRYMMVGNPYMCGLDIWKFMEANTNLDGNYWIETEDGPVVGSAHGDNWLSTDGNPLVGPYGAIFVKLKGEGAATSVSFDKDMQMLEGAGGRSAARLAALTVTATADGRSSGAVLAYDGNAADGFCDGEDAQLMTDLAGNATGVPLVYTVAGTTAASVNRVVAARRIPMGVFAGDGTTTTLTFAGTGELLNPRLYDAETSTETPLTDGYELTLTGPSHGRFFIVCDGPAASDIARPGVEASDLSAYSVAPGELIVTASRPLGLVSVYSASGALVKSVDAGGSDVCRITGLGSGVVVARVGLGGAVETRKVAVR